jgi:F-type H+-transporting ATPase subunit a
MNVAWTIAALASSGANPLEHVVQHPLREIAADLGPLTPEGVVTVMSDQIAMLILGGLVLVFSVPLLIRRRKGSGEIDRLVPKGGASAVEAICEFLRKEVAEPSLHQHTDRFIKYIWSVFFFVLTLNLLGLLPIGAIFPLFGFHIGGTATANIWVTGTLALTTLTMMIINGLRLGGKQYIAHFCPGPLWLAPILVPIEIIGVFAKGFALAVRLFANMNAGHILLSVLLGFILSAGTALGAAGGLAVAVPAVLGSVAVNMLEIFVAFLQAFIFTFLSTLFLGMSVVFHDH